MKRMKRIIACALAGAMALFALSACSNAKTEETIGTWASREIVENQDANATLISFYTFKEDGTFEINSYAGEELMVNREGSWEWNDDELVAHSDEETAEGLREMDITGTLEDEALSIRSNTGLDETLVKITEEEFDSLLVRSQEGFDQLYYEIHGYHKQ